MFDHTVLLLHSGNVRMIVAVAACTVGSIFAQPPAIGQNGIVNAASRIPPTLPGGAIARGALFSISGVRLGSSSRTTAVTLDPGGEARVVAVSSTRVDALMPQDAPLGPASVRVTVEGRASAAFPIQIVESNPGIFSRNDQGWGAGRIDNADPRGRTPNNDANPVRPRGEIVLAVSGLGEKKVIDVVIGNRVARGKARGAARPGEQEIVVEVPADAPTGCDVPAYLLIEPRRASNVVTLAIGTARCVSNPIPRLASGRLGLALFTRTLFRGRGQASTSVLDEAIVSFVAAGKTSTTPPLLLLPPAGTCSGYTSSFQSSTVLPNSISAAMISDFGAHGLDAGPSLKVRRDAATRDIPAVRGALGFYRIRLGSEHAPFGPQSRFPFLDPGEYDLTAPGGKDVGPVAVKFAAPAPLDWINRDRMDVIHRAEPATMRWEKAKPGFVLALAMNVDQITTAVGMSLCVAKSEARALTIPAALLANVPASRRMPGIPYDQLFVAWLPAVASPIRATGLDAGALVTMYAIGRNVEYR